MKTVFVDFLGMMVLQIMSFDFGRQSASLKYNISLTSSVEYRCLRILGLLTLETRFLRADLIEVFKILRAFENLDPDRFFQVIGDGARRGTVLNCSRRGIVWT